MRSEAEAILSQFGPIDLLFGEIISGQYRDDVVVRYYTSVQATIFRIAGENSVYARRFEKEMAVKYLELGGMPTLPGYVRPLYGIIQALRSDVQAGYLNNIKELIHADVFSDLLETSEYLLAEGHKDPAAVLAGGVLEGHLRSLCRKHGIDIEIADGSRKRPKMGEGMNTDLVKAGVYEKLQQKAITAWLDLRNKAAHGDYGLYEATQVSHLISGIRDLVLRFPA